MQHKALSICLPQGNRNGKGTVQILKAGDIVVHPSHGGCIVQGICNREFRGQTNDYYVLIPKSEPNTTILDPVDNAQKIGLHEVISPEQADQILSNVVDAPVDWVRDNAKRRQSYMDTLRTGTHSAIAQMIKELTVQSAKAALNQNDKMILQKAQRKLLSEIALAKGIDYDHALDLMDKAVCPTVS